MAGILNVRYLLPAIVLIAGLDTSLLGEDDLASLLNNYTLLRSKAEDAMDVAVSVSMIVDRENPRIVRFEERLYRQTFYRNSNFRVDGRIATDSDLAGNQSTGRIVEHVLKSGNNCFVHTPGVDGGMRKFAIKPPRLPITVFSGVLSPFDIALCTVFGFENHESVLNSIDRLRVFEAKKVDDSHTFYALSDNGKRVFFFDLVKKGEEYYPREFKNYANADSKSVPLDSMTTKELSENWKVVSKTKVEWKEGPIEEFLVPSAIFIDGNLQGRRVSIQLRMEDWNFDDKACSSRVNERNFLGENLQSYNFAVLEELFADRVR